MDVRPRQLVVGVPGRLPRRRVVHGRGHRLCRQPARRAAGRQDAVRGVRCATSVASPTACTCGTGPCARALRPRAPGCRATRCCVVRLVAIIAVARHRRTSSSCPSAGAGSRRWWTPVAMPIAASLAVLTTFLATVGVSEVAGASVRVDRRAQHRHARDVAVGARAPSGPRDRAGPGPRGHPRRIRRERALDVGHELVGRRRAGQGDHRRGLGGGDARRGPGADDVAVRRGGGQRGQSGMFGVDGPVGAGAVVHRPPGKPCVERGPRCAPGRSGAPGSTSSTPTSSSTWPGAKCSTRRSTPPGCTWGSRPSTPTWPTGSVRPSTSSVRAARTSSC